MIDHHDHSSSYDLPSDRADALDAPWLGRFLWRVKNMLGMNSAEMSVREALEELIETREEPEAPIDPDERVLLKNILKLKEVTVYDVMVPRAHIIAVELQTGFANVVKMMSEAAHSRLPIYNDTLDDVVGMVHIKDVLAASQSNEPVTLKSLMRPVHFVPPSCPALELLVDMRTNGTHLAMVVDEYGGIDGLVTIEDLVEQIVGEIEDEHDEEAAPVLQHDQDGTILADASTPLDELQDMIGNLPDTDLHDVDTLGGLVTAIAGRVPAQGESVTHSSGIVFDVIAADPRRIERIRVRNLPPMSRRLPEAPAA